MSLGDWYWRLFNLGAKIVAVDFIVVGSVMALLALPAIIDPNGTVLVDGIPESDLITRLIAFVAPITVAVFGFLLLRAKPYSPRDGSRAPETDA